jgi:hypothetical protein
MQGHPGIGFPGKYQCDPHTACNCGFQCGEQLGVWHKIGAGQVDVGSAPMADNKVA